MASTVLTSPDGKLIIEELGDGLRKLTVSPSRDVFVTRACCTTTYSIDLIQTFLDAAGLSTVCEVIGRDSDPDTVARSVNALTSAYLGPEELAGKRIMDFGCGGGSSTVALAKLFPHAEIVGTELEDSKIRLARARAQHHRITNVTFCVSPSGTELPDGLGKFDAIYLFAVYEHLLPSERPVIMRQLWDLLNPGGVLFLDATPHRYYPIELHSTKLPLINYLPDSVAHFAARRLSPVRTRINSSRSWEDHLRGGIRGATEEEIVRSIGESRTFKPVILNPTEHGLSDRCDYWFSLLSPKHRALKRAMLLVLKIIYAISGTVLTPNISLVIRKSECFSV